MTNYKVILMIMLCTISWEMTGQISPGDLSDAHASLEGISNCTQCHDLGKQVSSQKCLDCHVEINTLIKQDLGYHASGEVQNKECIECHSEHHGRKFDMVRFDEENFNHNLTGYTLKGQHDVIDCRDCHKPDFIGDSEIRKREDTFLGLTSDCLSCHEDFHQNTLSPDCISCHNFDAFRPASKFDHKNAEFNLEGKHVEVDCKACHPINDKNGKEFQEFTGIAFSQCIDCHDNPHNNVVIDCKTCHSVQGFETFSGGRTFDHNSTGFRLKGKHTSVSCFECHSDKESTENIFGDQSGISQNQCIACHDDVHEGKFGTDCASCHQETSFHDLKAMNDFDHNLTDYPLEGKHVSVDCAACHTSDNYTTPIDFSACKNCHEDYHEGEFIENGNSPDCVDCHSLEKGFDYSLFTIERHQDSNFPLDGSHLATPCFACHVSEDKWTFRNIGIECIDCHDNIHKGFISEEYIPDNNCKACHTTDIWSAVSFEHTLTEWPLEGEHKNVDCKSCHSDESNTEEEWIQLFEGISTECIACHENIHGDQFELNGETACIRCHIPESWEPVNFNHDETDFPLEGKHLDVDCKECHNETDPETERTIYTIKSYECVDCHG